MHQRRCDTGREGWGEGSRSIGREQNPSADALRASTSPTRGEVTSSTRNQCRGPSVVSGQKLERLFARGKTAHLAIVGIVFGCIGRAHSDKLVAILFNELSQTLTVEGRHMPCAAMRAIVVAHAGPLIGPYPPAACASVEIQKPGHAGLLGTRSQS